jgi:hypothetical protein
MILPPPPRDRQAFAIGQMVIMMQAIRELAATHPDAARFRTLLQSRAAIVRSAFIQEGAGEPDLLRGFDEGLNDILNP